MHYVGQILSASTLELHGSNTRDRSRQYYLRSIRERTRRRLQRGLPQYDWQVVRVR